MSTIQPHPSEDNSSSIAISLTRGFTAIISREDADLSKRSWFAFGVGGYAAATILRKTVFLHGVILERKLGRSLREGMIADHIDGDHHNNTRENLREANSLQNARNRRPRIDGVAGIKGVRFFAQNGKWQSRIMVNGVSLHLGYYSTAEDAALAYDNAALMYFGEFARTNYDVDYILSMPNPIPPTVYKVAGSGFRGVDKNHPSYGRWCASIKHKKQSTYLGTFDTAEQAARAYDRAAIQIHGNKAKLNFPRSDYESAS